MKGSTLRAKLETGAGTFADLRAAVVVCTIKKKHTQWRTAITSSHVRQRRISRTESHMVVRVGKKATTETPRQIGHFFTSMLRRDPRSAIHDTVFARKSPPHPVGQDEQIEDVAVCARPTVKGEPLLRDTQVASRSRQRRKTSEPRGHSSPTFGRRSTMMRHGT